MKNKSSCSKIAHIPYNLISTIKCNDSSILSFANEYVGDITIPTQVIKYMYNQLDVVPCGSASSWLYMYLITWVGIE
jgi:hypothetical protein